MRNRPDRTIRRVITSLLVLLTATVHVGADVSSEQLEGFREQAEVQIEKALAYLARAQQPEGAFPGGHGKTNGAVGLCAMAFMAHGHTPGKGPYGSNINRCLDYIITGAAENGYMGTRGGRMYSHCIATLLMGEVSGMVDPVRQEKVDAILPKAIRVILDAQKAKKFNGSFVGGWRYTPPDTTSDLSVSGWAIMALRSARLNGAPVPHSAIKQAIGFVMKSRMGAGRFRYLIWGNQFPSRPMTAVAILCLELGGHHHHGDGLRGGNYILERPLDFGGYWAYGQYYTSQAMFQLGGTYWERFATEFYPHVLGRQGEDGNWGAPYHTAMTVLSLGVTCRQLPIYQR